MINTYIEIFKDAFLSHLLFTLGGEVGFETFSYFTDKSEIEKYYIAASVATVASSIAILINFFVFSIMRKLIQKTLDKNYSYEPFCRMIQGYYPLLLVWAYFEIFSMLAGFFGAFGKLNWVKYLLTIAVYRALYYSWLTYSL